MAMYVKEPKEVKIVRYSADGGEETNSVIYRGALTELENVTDEFNWGHNDTLSLSQIGAQIDEKFDGDFYTVITETPFDGHIYQYDADGRWRDVAGYKGYLRY